MRAACETSGDVHLVAAVPATRTLHSGVKKRFLYARLFSRTLAGPAANDTSPDAFAHAKKHSSYATSVRLVKCRGELWHATPWSAECNTARHDEMTLVHMPLRMSRRGLLQRQ